MCRVLLASEQLRERSRRYKERIISKMSEFPGPTVIEGILWPPTTSQKSLDAVRNLDIRDNDVIIVAFPKSGTHWLQEIVALINVDGDVEKINRKEHCMPLEFGPDEIEKVPCYERIQTWKSPRVLKTHVLEDILPRQLKEGKGKVIYVFRNPKDVAVSLWHFLKENGVMFQDWNSFITSYINGQESYGPWYDHVKQYWLKHKDSKNFLFLYYEDLKKDHREGVIKIGQFLGRSLSEEAIDKIVEHSSFKGMKQTHHLNKNVSQDKESASSDEKPTDKKAGADGIIRKGMVGDWKNFFTVSQNELFDSVFAKQLDDTGITIEYV